MPDDVRTVPGARWSCRSTGHCCRGFEFGPVEPDIIAGLQTRDIATVWAPAAEAPWFEERTGPDGATTLYLTHRDGHCVFLRDDALCAVHAAFGAEAKPWFCREYPLHVVQDPQGAVVVARADCGGFHDSFIDGEPVADQAAAAIELPRPHPARTFAPEQVVVLPGAAVSLGDWMTLEGVLLPGLDRAPPEASVGAFRDRLHDLVNRTAPTPDPAAYRHASSALIGALLRLAEDMERQLGEQAGYRGTLAHTASQALAAAASRIDDPLPQLDPVAVDYLHLVLRSELLSKQFQNLAGVPFGLGLHLLTTDVARRAATGAGPLSAAEVAEVLPWLKRWTHHGAVHALLGRARPALADLFMHVG